MPQYYSKVQEAYNWKLLKHFCSFCLFFFFQFHTAFSQYWILPKGSNDTVFCAFIDYRHIPQDNNLFLTYLSGKRDTIQHLSDTLSSFYADGSIYVLFPREELFLRKVVSGEIEVYQYSYDLIKSDHWKNEFAFQNRLMTTPGTGKNFYTDRRSREYFVLNADTHELNRNTYKNILWPIFQNNLELNQKAVHRAKYYEWFSIIDYFNSNFSSYVDRIGQNHNVFGLQPLFVNGYLETLSYFDYGGNKQSFDSKSSSLAVASFEFRSLNYKLIIDPDVVIQKDEMPRHTWLRIDGDIKAYYYENVYTYREIDEAFEYTEIKTDWILSKDNKEFILLDADKLTDWLKPIVSKNEAFLDHYTGKFEFTDYDIGEIIGLYNYWQQKSPTNQ